MVVAQGDVCWTELPDAAGSAPAYRRPVVVVQGDALNRSRLATVVCVPLTSQLKWASAPGNALLRSRQTGLPKDSVANVSQVLTIDKDAIVGVVGKLSRRQLGLILNGINVVLGR